MVSAPSRSSTAPALPLRSRQDLQTVEVDYAGQTSYVVKDPIGLRYHRLVPVQHHLLQLLTQPQPLEDLETAIRQFDISLQMDRGEILSLLSDFHEKGLIYSTRPGQSIELRRLRLKQLRAAWKTWPQKVLFCKFPGWSPAKLLNILTPVSRVLLHPAVLVCMGLLILAASLLVIREYDTFQRRLPALQQFFSWQNLPYLWLSIAFTKLIHELGHAMVCRRCGAEPHQIGVMLLMFAPTAYCDVTDSWMLRSKWKRIAIGFGGPYFEWVLASISLFIWWWTEPGWLHYVSLNIFVLSAVTTTIFNLNPLVKFDGYYILSDWLEIPNLRQQADRAVQAAFCRNVFGAELPRNPFEPEMKTNWLLFYSVSAWLYRWTILAGITVLLYVMLKPAGLERFAFVAAAGSVATMIWQLAEGIRNAVRQIQPLRPSRWRTFTAGTAGLVIAAAAFAIPIPYWIVCLCELQPRDVLHARALVAGRLEAVEVIPGENVQAGQVLLRLANPDLTDELREARNRQERLQTALIVARLKQDHEQVASLHTQLESTADEIAHVQDAISRLTLLAPCDGRVYPAERKTAAESSRQQALPGWNGTIFDHATTNAWIAKGTPLLAIAPHDEMEAILTVDQHIRNDLKPGQPVQLQCSLWPGSYFQSSVTKISERDAIHSSSEGRNQTVADVSGQQAVPTSVYRAVAPLANVAPASLPALGSNGLARITVTHRTAAQWVWRFVCQTFRFRL